MFFKRSEFFSFRNEHTDCWLVLLMLYKLFILDIGIYYQFFYFFNSIPGALGCRFFTKRKIPRETPSELNVIFQLYVGAKLCIDNFQFVLIDVEDRTLRFMMNHPNEVSFYVELQIIV